MNIGQLITIDGVPYRITSIYEFMYNGKKRISLTLQKIRSRGAVYHVVKYESGMFSSVTSLGPVFHTK